MLAVHLLLTEAIILFALSCAVWGLVGAIRHRPPSPSYRATLLIAEGLFGVQALVGLALFAGGRQPGQVLHFLYGFLGVAVLPAVLGITARDKRRGSLWLGLTALFLVGVAVRAWMTGA